MKYHEQTLVPFKDGSGDPAGGRKTPVIFVRGDHCPAPSLSGIFYCGWYDGS